VGTCPDLPCVVYGGGQGGGRLGILGEGGEAVYLLEDSQEELRGLDGFDKLNPRVSKPQKFW